MNRINEISSVFIFFFAFCLLMTGCGQKKAPTAARLDVTIQQMQFMPAEIHVHQGDTVVFTNKDFVTHDVTEETKQLWTSGPVDPEGSYLFIAQKDASYYCSIHPVMKGKIIIEQ